MTGAKKLIEIKNKLFYARLPCEGIFEIHPYWGLIFWLFFQKFEQLFLNGETFFQKRTLWVGKYITVFSLLRVKFLATKLNILTARKKQTFKKPKICPKND